MSHYIFDWRFVRETGAIFTCILFILSSFPSSGEIMIYEFCKDASSGAYITQQMVT